MRSAMIALAILAPVHAAAQTAAPDAARLKARAMISRVWADAAFAAEAWENGPLVRHRRTGLVCRFNGDDRNTVDVYEGEKFSMVGCTIHDGDLVRYSYGNPPAVDVDQIAMSAEASLAKAYANLEPLPTPAAAPSGAGLPPITVRSFTGDRGGRRWYIQLASMDLSRWSYSQRAVGPIERRAEIDRIGLQAMLQQAKDAGYSAP